MRKKEMYWNSICSIFYKPNALKSVHFFYKRDRKETVLWVIIWLLVDQSGNRWLLWSNCIFFALVLTPKTSTCSLSYSQVLRNAFVCFLYTTKLWILGEPKSPSCLSYSLNRSETPLEGVTNSRSRRHTTEWFPQMCNLQGYTSKKEISPAPLLCL